MKKSILLVLVLVVVLAATAYATGVSDRLFGTSEKSAETLPADDASLQDIADVKTPITPTPSVTEPIIDTPKAAAVTKPVIDTPVVTEPDKVLNALTPKDLRANYKSYLNSQVTVTGVIDREIRCDDVEPPSDRNCITVISLTSPDQNTLIDLQDNTGETIQCSSSVDTCQGYTDGETATLIGTVIPLAISFALRLN